MPDSYEQILDILYPMLSGSRKAGTGNGTSGCLIFTTNAPLNDTRIAHRIALEKLEYKDALNMLRRSRYRNKEIKLPKDDEESEVVLRSYLEEVLGNRPQSVKLLGASLCDLGEAEAMRVIENQLNDHRTIPSVLALDDRHLEWYDGH